jgi:hypothetical protein
VRGSLRAPNKNSKAIASPAAVAIPSGSFIRGSLIGITVLAPRSEVL